VVSQISGFCLERARFDSFVGRDGMGTACFKGRYRLSAGRHRDRVWPALSRYKRLPRKTDAWHQRSCSISAAKINRAIAKACLLIVLRRWDPMNPLDAWHVKQCDRAQRPPRYDPCELMAALAH
jgi:hypothetical protein